MKQEVFSMYLLPLAAAAVTGLAGFIGMQLKKLYETYVNDRTKEAVVRTCVKAAEQLYHDLSGPDKLEKAREGIVEMLNEKGIPISELELNLLIESVVSEFNYGFTSGADGTTSYRWEADEGLGVGRAGQDPPLQVSSGDMEYSEEGGSL